MMSRQRSHDHRQSGVKHAASSPGGRQETARTCRSIVKSRSSTHTGRPQPGGTLINRGRNRGKARIRPPISWRRSSRPRSPGRSKIKITANCSGTLPVSIARNAKSAGLARSITDRSSFGVSTRRRLRVVDSTFPSHSALDGYRRVKGHPDARAKTRADPLCKTTPPHETFRRTRPRSRRLARCQQRARHGCRRDEGPHWGRPRAVARGWRRRHRRRCRNGDVADGGAR